VNRSNGPGISSRALNGAKGECTKSPRLYPPLKKHDGTLFIHSGRFARDVVLATIILHIQGQHERIGTEIATIASVKEGLSLFVAAAQDVNSVRMGKPFSCISLYLSFIEIRVRRKRFRISSSTVLLVTNFSDVTRPEQKGRGVQERLYVTMISCR